MADRFPLNLPIIVQQGAYYEERHEDRTADGTVIVYAADEVQTVAITGSPTGGTFTLTFAGQTTAALAYNATAADVEAALEALSTIGAGNVVAAGGPLPGSSVNVTFRGDLAATDVALMTATGSLTGGTSPAVAITEATVGGTGWAGTMHVRDEVGGTLIWEGTTSDGRLVIGPQDDGAGTTWQVLISIPHADTESLPAGFVGVYELKLQDPVGRWHSYLKGQFCVDGEVADV